MEIQLAKQHGFCFGVKRAIQIAEEYKNSFTFGPLIHNNLEIQRLKNQFNVGLKENIEEFKSGDKLIIRTHGIEKENLDYLHQNNIKFIDEIKDEFWQIKEKESLSIRDMEEIIKGL